MTVGDSLEKREKVIQENYVFRYSRIVRKTFPITLGKLFWLVLIQHGKLAKELKAAHFLSQAVEMCFWNAHRGHVWASS